MPILFQKWSQYWPPHAKGFVLRPIHLQFPVIHQVVCLAILGIADRHWGCALAAETSGKRHGRPISSDDEEVQP